MKNILKITLAFVVVVAMGNIAHAGILASFLVNGQNTLEDGSREVFIDLVDSDSNPLTTSIDVGDVLIGFSKMTGIEPYDSLPGPDSTPNSVYAIFSQQFSFVGADLDASSDLFRKFEFAPTTAAGLKLSDLLGVLNPGGIGDGMVAVVSHASSAFSVDLANTSPGDRGAGPAGIDFADYLDVLLDEGTLDLVFGKSVVGDFFKGQTGTTIDDTEDFIASFANLANTSVGENLVNFEAELSLLYDGMPSVLVTSKGIVTGGTARLPLAGENPDGIFTFTDDADLLFDAQVVPEPATIAMWSVFATGLLALRRRRLK
jgi:hypothetical protein